MKIRFFTFLLSTLPLTAGHAAMQTTTSGDPAPQATYLLPGAPTFDLSISQFREKFNHDNPTLKLTEFRAIGHVQDKANLMRAASKINENLYASTALERCTLKIKSMQITWLPIPGPDKKAAQDTAWNWMAALMRVFTPGLTKEQSQNRLKRLLREGKRSGYYAWNEGAIRYVVADNGEKGLTLAIEPVKLTLSENSDTHS